MLSVTYFIVVLSVIMVSAIMLIVIMLIAVMLGVIMMSVLMLNVVMLSVVTPFMLSVIMVSVIMLNVIMLSTPVQAWSKPKIFQKSVSSQNFIYWLNTCYFPACWLLILCYQLVQNGTGSTGTDWNGTGTDKSHFRFIGCLDARSCLPRRLNIVWLQVRVKLTRRVVSGLNPSLSTSSTPRKSSPEVTFRASLRRQVIWVFLQSMLSLGSAIRHSA